MLTLFWNSAEQRCRSLVRILAQAICFFILVMFLATPVVLLFGVRNELPLIVVQLLAVAGSVWLVGKYVDKRKFKNFGFDLNRRWFLDCAFGFGLGAALMALIFVVEWSAGWIRITDTFVKPANEGSFLFSFASMFLFFICVGIEEELLSRGYQLTNLAEGLQCKWFGKATATIVAVILSSALFGLMHIGNPNASWMSTANIALAGMFLAAGYVLTGELAIPIGVHVSWNFFQGNVFGFPVSGNVFGTKVIAIEQGGNQLITGGSFGPEAGLIGIAAILLGTVAVVLWVRWRHGQLSLAKVLSKSK